MAFKIAGSMAFKDAMQKAGAVLLEPIMKVEVTMPEEYMLSLIHICGVCVAGDADWLDQV